MVGGACPQANMSVIASQGSRERERWGKEEKKGADRGGQGAISGHEPLVAMAMTPV